MSFRALLLTTWGCFRAESGWAGRGDGGEWPRRAGAAERGQSGRQPRGVQAPPAAGVSAGWPRSRGVRRGISGGGAHGGVLAGASRNAGGSFSAPEKRADGHRSPPPPLRRLWARRMGFPPLSHAFPLWFARRANYFQLSPCGKDDPSLI